MAAQGASDGDQLALTTREGANRLTEVRSRNAQPGRKQGVCGSNSTMRASSSSSQWSILRRRGRGWRSRSGCRSGARGYHLDAAMPHTPRGRDGLRSHPLASRRGDGLRPDPASRSAPRAGAVPRLFPPALEPRLEPAAGRARLLPRNLCLRDWTLRRRPGDRSGPLPCKSHSVLPPSRIATLPCARRTGSVDVSVIYMSRSGIQGLHPLEKVRTGPYPGS